MINKDDLTSIHFTHVGFRQQQKDSANVASLSPSAPSAKDHRVHPVLSDASALLVASRNLQEQRGKNDRTFIPFGSTTAPNFFPPVSSSSIIRKSTHTAQRFSPSLRLAAVEAAAPPRTCFLATKLSFPLWYRSAWRTKKFAIIRSFACSHVVRPAN